MAANPENAHSISKSNKVETKSEAKSTAENKSDTEPTVTEPTVKVKFTIEPKSDQPTSVQPKSEAELSSVNPFLVNNENLILLDVPAGKPNRKKVKPNDPKRVSQPATKRPNNMFYGFKIHAMLSPNYLERQKMYDRKSASEYRKALTLARAELEIHKDHEKYRRAQIGAAMTFLRSLNLDPWDEYQKMLKARRDRNPKIQKIKEFTSGINDFVNDTFKKFQEKGLDFLIHEEMKELNLKFKELNPEEDLDAFSTYKSLEEIPLDEKTMMFHYLIQPKLAKVFDCAESPWTPQNSARDLFNLIKKTQKPLCIEGFYGPGFYKDNPYIVEKISHYQVKGFNKGTHMVDNKIPPQASTFVAVIGVEIDPKNENKSFVYYIDPLLGSKVNSAGKGERIIFKLSYEKFKHLCTDTTHESFIWNVDKGLERRSGPKFKYGYI